MTYLCLRTLTGYGDISFSRITHYMTLPDWMWDEHLVSLGFGNPERLEIINNYYSPLELELITVYVD